MPGPGETGLPTRVVSRYLPAPRGGRLFALLAAGFLSAPGAALAQLDDTGSDSGGGSGKGFGVGMEALLTAPFSTTFSPSGAVALSYDAGDFRVDGLLFMSFIDGTGNNNQTAFAIGARAFYVLHSSSKADFSVGGGLVFGFLDGSGSDGDFRVGIDGAAQIRVWLASNVALSGSVGIGFAVPDPFTFALSGQLTGGFGLIYYFD